MRFYYIALAVASALCTSTDGFEAGSYSAGHASLRTAQQEDDTGMPRFLIDENADGSRVETSNDNSLSKPQGGKKVDLHEERLFDILYDDDDDDKLLVYDRYDGRYHSRKRYRVSRYHDDDDDSYVYYND
ncbi:unnamed protein product [Peronospora belbahrii]|uniref:RxLR effector protein n=1 Tax=Peronospora belbahrii TaxID=622444 RepID=A0AAU9L060_9STRA|nr:unnamed protein product [Peronospora belbahrii]CAH0521140.1 unnamed protein product [Peronospora belbahrii]